MQTTGASSLPNRLDRFEFRLSTPDVKSDRLPGGFSVIHLEGFGTLGRRSGAPSLPLKTYLVAIPPGVTPSLEVRLTGETTFRPGVLPQPVPTRRVQPTDIQATALTKADADPWKRAQILAEAAELVYEADPAVYEGQTVFPAQIARLGRIGTLRDQRYVEVLVSPVRFDPAIQGLRIHESLDVTVSFEGHTPASKAARDERLFEPIYRESLANYVQGKQFRLSGYQLRDHQKPSSAGRSGDQKSDAPEKGALSPRQRIVVREDGMVLLDYNRLIWVSGLLDTDVNQWLVTRNGETVPLEVHDDGDGVIEPGEWVRFYGQAYDEDPKTRLSVDFPDHDKDLFEADDYTDETTYFLTVETIAPPKLASIDAAPVGRTPAEFHLETIHQEENDAFRPLGGEDAWYWLPTLVTTGENPANRVLTFPAPGLYDPTLPVDVLAKVRGTSTIDHIAIDHPFTLRLKNDAGTTLASEVDGFDSLTLFTKELTWTYPGSGAVASDPLYVELEVMPNGGGRNDVIPDFFELTYRRAFTAVDDSLQFNWPDEDAEFIVDGFTTAEIDVFEITPNPATGGVVMKRLDDGVVSGAGPYEIRFRVDDDPDADIPRTFLAIGNGLGAVPVDADFTSDTVSTLRDPLNQADMIVIGHEDLLDDAPGSVLDQLLTYKASAAGGEISSIVARLQDVYDEFNGGQPGPLAIHEFLRWVMSTDEGEGWADPKPTYVMLLGDGSFDYKGGPGRGNFVPTQVMFKLDPQLGYYASDNLMAAVVGDDQSPDLVIGRVPSRSVEQVNMVLQKSLDYQTAPNEDGVWRRHALFISDRGNSSGEGNLDFEITNGRAQALICSDGEDTFDAACPGDTPFTSQHLRYYSDYYTNQAVFNPPFKMGLDLKAAVNGENGIADGAVILQYGGHGNFVVWSGDAFFDQRPPTPPDVIDTEELNNGDKLPWLMAHNCLTGGFHITQASTMGEDWLHREGGGSIGVFSPTGLSFNYVGNTVTDIIWGSLYGRYKTRSIAVPVMSTLTTLCAQGSFEPCQHYALLGDPSLRLNLRYVEPASGLTAVASNNTVDLSWTASPTPGTTYELYRNREFFNVEKVNDAPIVGTSYTDTGLLNATNYLYYVVAVDPEGFESPWSNFNEDCSEGSTDCVIAMPLNPDPPAMITGLTVSDPGLGDRLDFHWDPSPEDDLAFYTVYYGNAPDNYTTVQAVGKLPALSVSGLAEGETLYFTVSATNTSDKTSATADPVEDFPVRALGLRPPGLIADLRVDKVGVDLLLEWDEISEDSYGKPANVMAYEIFRGSGYSNETLTKIADCVAPCTGYTDPGAANLAGPVQYRVRALDLAGLAGGMGAEFPRGTTLTVNPSPTTPGNIVLSWPAVETTVSGAPVAGISYIVIASNRTFTKEAARNGSASILLITTETSIDITPEATSRYYSILAVDEKGNVSPF